VVTGGHGVNGARVLVISGDDFLAEAVVHALRNDNHEVERTPSWKSAERMLPDLRPQLLVIDAESEGVGERPVVDRVRIVTDVPLVVLSPSVQLEDRLAALRAGADEVMAKPFVLSELACKVTALTRRNGYASPVIELGDLVIDEASHTVARRGSPIELTAIEFALLATFSRHRSQVLSKAQLLTMVWGFDDHKVNLVEVHVSALRRKLEAAGPRIIHTVRGVGYALRPVEPEAPEPAAHPVREKTLGRGRCDARHDRAFRPLRRRSLALT
jgi:two-component system OmpR family response regulator